MPPYRRVSHTYREKKRLNEDTARLRLKKNRQRKIVFFDGSYYMENSEMVLLLPFSYNVVALRPPGSY